MTTLSSANRIRDLNDAMRKAGISSGKWMMTAGVMAQGPDFMLLATRAVQTFSAFSEDNDPYGEHDFGAFDIAGNATNTLGRHASLCEAARNISVSRSHVGILPMENAETAHRQGERCR